MLEREACDLGETSFPRLKSQVYIIICEYPWLNKNFSVPSVPELKNLLAGLGDLDAEPLDEAIEPAAVDTENSGRGDLPPAGNL